MCGIFKKPQFFVIPKTDPPKRTELDQLQNQRTYSYGEGELTLPSSPTPELCSIFGIIKLIISLITTLVNILNIDGSPYGLLPTSSLEHCFLVRPEGPWEIDCAQIAHF